MASNKSFISKPSYDHNQYFNNINPKSSLDGSMFEFDEADLWNSNNNNSHESKNKNKAMFGSRSGLKRASRKVDHAKVGPAASSLPVNIPDWSKILKEDYKEHRKWDIDDDVDNDDDDGPGGMIRVPPHEYLARTRGASLSVHEGIGRTLKGRDLRSVRNAIWKKVGFED